MNVTRDKNLKDVHPVYRKAMTIFVVAFMCAVSFFLVNLLGVWLDSNNLRLITIVLVGCSIVVGVICFAIMLLIFIASALKKS